MDQPMRGTDMTMAFDHLGVLASSLSQGRHFLGNSLGVDRWTVEFEDAVNDVFVQFGQCPSGMCYEVVAPRSPSSPVGNALKRRINVINHIAYRVADLASHAERLKDAGFMALNEARPAVAYGHRYIQFFVNAQLFLLELIEAGEHRHHFVQQARTDCGRNAVTARF